MAERIHPDPARPSKFEDRYRLYLDESGDHVYRGTGEIAHRYLCLLGCWFRNPDYLRFHEALEDLKARHLPHHPDEPVVLHRDDMINARKAFKNLRDEATRERFDSDLLQVIQAGDFKVVAVVIDKHELRRSYGETASHPYHLGLGFLLQRFAGYLNHINRVGDILGESRGGKEDRLLKESYSRVFERGVWRTKAHAFQSALTSRELKLKPKGANIAGLQLADLLGHPVKQWVLKHYGHADVEPAPFAQRLMGVVETKLNRHLYDDRAEGYGMVLFPRK
ncbi:MAG TPA: DUF3800 domain-containing protein [Candidatus Binatia bacterium]|nr:DUF3800 domain-containing protein [Candidatus Binatia bacterium]